MNVVWIQTDEQRVDSLGCYGSTWARTPHIDRLASEGVLFENTVCQAPVCVPSRSSQIWVNYPQCLGCLNNRALSQAPPEGSLAFTEVLAREGYLTASFGKRHTMGRGIWQEGDSFVIDERHVGFYGLPAPYDETAHRILKRPGSAPIILAGSYPDVPENPATHVTDAALDFVRKHDRSRPFFLRVNHLFPHTPVLPPRPWESLYRPEELPIRYFDAEMKRGRPEFDQAKAECDRMDLLNPGQIRQMWGDYMGLCAYVDHEVGRLLESLKQMDVLDDTLVFFSSDHGKSLGEWGAGEKDTFDDCVWRVPFIWWRPGLLPQGQRRKGVCELVDTARSLLGLLGLEHATSPGWAGRNLFKEGERGVGFGIISPEWGYTDGAGPRFRAAVRDSRYRMDVTLPFDWESADEAQLDGGLYDLAEDPHETLNLFNDAGLRPVVSRLLMELKEWLHRCPLDARLHDQEQAGRLY